MGHFTFLLQENTNTVLLAEIEPSLGWDHGHRQTQLPQALLTQSSSRLRYPPPGLMFSRFNKTWTNLYTMLYILQVSYYIPIYRIQNATCKCQTWSSTFAVFLLCTAPRRWFPAIVTCDQRLCIDVEHDVTSWSQMLRRVTSSLNIILFNNYPNYHSNTNTR